MSAADRSEYLGALVAGFHFASPWYSIANSFNYILDEVSKLPGFQIYSLGHHELAYRTEELHVVLNKDALMTKSPLFLDKNRVGTLDSKTSRRSEISLPIRVFNMQQEFIKAELQVAEQGAAKKRDDFIKQTTVALEVIDKITIGDMQPFKFIGMIEYYFIPVDEVNWLILDKFTTQARIQGAVNSEKYSVNRYDFTDKAEDYKRCLIFTLENPKADNVATKLAAASFDFQIIPLQSKTFEDFGGIKESIKKLEKGLNDIIEKSEFMKVSQKV